MKSYNHIWEILISDENIEKSIKSASRGKRNRTEVIKTLDNMDESIKYFRSYATHYVRRVKAVKIIKEGKKERKIVVPSFKEQVLHHMIVGAVQPIIMKSMYYHSHGSIPGKGAAIAKRNINKWIAKGKNVKYFLKTDIRHFFASIDHDKLKAFIASKIHDYRYVALVNEVIDCCEEGVPLGFHTSHWFANWFLQDFDYFIKQELGAVYYVRFVDDVVIFGSNKRFLHECRKRMADFLKDIGLEMKSNWQVCRFHKVVNGEDKYRFLDFLGFRFYRNRTTLRKWIMLRMCRKARRFSKHPSLFHCRQILSALGWLKQTDTYFMYLEHIKPYVSFRNVRKKISRISKRLNKINKKEGVCGRNLKTA